MYNTTNGLADLSKNSAPVALGSLSYTTGNFSYNSNIYPKSEEDKKILNGLLWSDIRNKNESDVMVTVNDSQVPAKLYSFEINQPEVIPYAAVEGGPVQPVGGCTTDCFKKQYILIFEYKNNKYSFQEFAFSAESNDLTYSPSEDGVFKSYSSNSSSDLVQIQDLLTRSIKGTYVDGSTGSGGTVVEPTPVILK